MVERLKRLKEMADRFESAALRARDRNDEVVEDKMKLAAGRARDAYFYAIRKRSMNVPETGPRRTFFTR